MGTFITNILKINAKQLLNKKIKRTKTANSLISSRNQYGSASSIHSAPSNRGGGSYTSLNYYHQTSATNNFGQKLTKNFFSPAQTSLIITSPLANQQLKRNKSSNKSLNNENFSRNGPSPSSSGFFNNMDVYFNGYEDDYKKIPS